MEKIYKKTGFTLIELICSMLIISVLVALSGAFIASGVQGFFINRRASQAALEARNALNRIRAEFLEISKIEEISAGNSSIRYKSDNPLLWGVEHTLLLDSELVKLRIDSNSDAAQSYTLINGVESFIITVTSDDLDAISGDEISCIEAKFKLKDIGTQFSARVYPRNMIDWP